MKTFVAGAWEKREEDDDDGIEFSKWESITIQESRFVGVVRDADAQGCLHRDVTKRQRLAT